MATHKDIKSLTPAEVREMAAHFDDHIRNGLSIEDQIAFLASTARHSPSWMNDDPLTANPAFMTLKTSLLAANIFSPENLARLPNATIVRLSEVAHDADYLLSSNCAPTPLLRTILGSTILKPVVRVMFVPHLINPDKYNHLSASSDPLFVMYRKAHTFVAQTKRAECEFSYPSRHAILQRYKRPEWTCDIKSINKDDPISFRLEMDISGRRISDALIIHLLNSHARRIVSSIISSGGTFPGKTLSLDKLAAYICQTSDAETVTEVISAIESKQPGMLKTVSDGCGNNLLWYTLYRADIDYRSDYYAHITKPLLEVGVAPNQTNQLNLSWRNVIEARAIWNENRNCDG